MSLQPFKVVIDSREQLPWEFGPDVETTGGTLASGDYSIHGLQHLVAIERKSLPDLVACVGPERERFERELHRLQSYRVAGVVVEATLADVLSGNHAAAADLIGQARGALATFKARQTKPGAKSIWTA